VIQVYEGLVYMDFSESAMHEVDGLQCGRYERIDARSLPLVYVAYNASVSEPTEVFHNNLRARFEAGEPQVVEAMKRFAGLAAAAKEALAAGDDSTLAQLIDANFDVRRSICRLPSGQVEMIERARRAGASAKFAGSGGAIIGTFPDEAVFSRLQRDLGEIGCRVIKPIIFTT
jgi:glucuronokinase